MGGCVYGLLVLLLHSGKKNLKRKERVFHIAFRPFSVRIKHIEALPITNALLLYKRFKEKSHSKQTVISVYSLLQTFAAPDCTEYEKAVLKAAEDSGTCMY